MIYVDLCVVMLIECYEYFVFGGLDVFVVLYVEYCCFKDFFNEVQGCVVVCCVFEYMFEMVVVLCFVVKDVVVDGD